MTSVTEEEDEERCGNGSYDKTRLVKYPVSQIRMKICVLDSSYERSNSVFKGVDYSTSPARYLPYCDVKEVHLHKATAISQIRETIKENFDVYINLCDGSWDADLPGLEVAVALEKLGLPFTGSPSAVYDPSRETMKMVAFYTGVKSPPGVFAYHEEDIERAACLNFPLLAKHYNSLGSIGLTKACKCYDMESLRRESKRILKEYGGVLIEEFITGPEFTVLASENPVDLSKPIVYQPVQCFFPQGEEFKHFDLKWKDFDGIHWRPVKDEELNKRLKDMASKAFLHIMNGMAYGRIDVRQRASDGELFLLEINPQPGIFYPECSASADEILVHDKEHDHVTFLETLIQAALNRHSAAQKVKNIAVVRSYPNMTGYGLFAGRDIKEGEVIQEGEGKPYVLVSKKYLQSPAGRSNQNLTRWFNKYAYPVNDTLFITWSDTPEEWRPINHSCDPNCWAEGLNITARRDIKSGEELTVDYGTYYGEVMEPFECKCKSTECRRRIEWREDLSYTMKYGDHVSDYIACKRRMKESRSLDC